MLLTSVVDPELIGQVGSGIVVPDPDMTFFDKKSVYFCKFFHNGPNRLWPLT